MPESKELAYISDSLLRFLVFKPVDSRKSTFEIYNEWSYQTNITIQHPGNLKWALQFIEAKKNAKEIKSAAMLQILSGMKKEKNYGTN